MWHKAINKTFFLKIFRKVKEDIKTKETQSSVLLLAFTAIWIFLGLNAALLWLLFLAFAFYDWDNRVVGVLAVFTLMTCPILLQFKQDAYAETMAVYAYFFLVMTVALQIIEYKRHD